MSRKLATLIAASSLVLACYRIGGRIPDGYDEQPPTYDVVRDLPPWSADSRREGSELDVVTADTLDASSEVVWRDVTDLGPELVDVSPDPALCTPTTGTSCRDTCTCGTCSLNFGITRGVCVGPMARTCVRALAAAGACTPRGDLHAQRAVTTRAVCSDGILCDVCGRCTISVSLR
jgi:hypothetical protein